jgi:hypothetical protein
MRAPIWTVSALRRGHSEAPSPTPRGIALEIAVLDRNLQDLAEARQRLVDHLVPERAPADGLAALAGGAQCVSLPDLEIPVAVDLLDRDLGQPVLREKRQQVVGDLVLVGRHRVRPELPLRAVEPLGCKLVEGRLPFGRLGD